MSLLSVPEALARVLALMTPVGAEDVPLAQAAGRVLAGPAVARRTQPPFAASAMDGYAVRGAEVRPGAVFRVIGRAQAGAGFDGAVGPGEAVRIFTGAPVPPGADRVVIQEDAEVEGDAIRLAEALDAGPYVRPAGLDFAEGDAFDPGRRLRAADVSLLAAMNLPAVTVRRRPVVALIPTGDELVDPGQDPGPDQIVSSNGHGLAALFEGVGAEARLMPIARDSEASLRAAFEAAADADLVVTLGGASVGEHDLVQDVGRAMGLDLGFYRIAMRPGKPLMAGRFPDGPAMVGLPGNPVSSLVCAHVFLRPAVDAMLGLPAGPLPRIRARLAEDVGPTGPREHYARAALIPGDPPQARVFDRQDSSMLRLMAEADALAVFPPGAPARARGEWVDVILL